MCIRDRVALGANVLKLRPVILVQDGKMNVGKKFRGSYNDCMQKYIESKLGAVSYTHLDVYKRQLSYRLSALTGTGKTSV